MFAHVRAVLSQDLTALVAQQFGAARHSGRALQRLDDEVKSAGLVEYDHVERSRGRAFFAVAAHVEALSVRPAVEQLVYRTRIAMKRENDIPVFGEKLG